MEIEAPPDRVWAVIADPRNLPRWDRRVTKVYDLPEGPLEKGDGYATDLRFMGLRTTIRARVAEIRPPDISVVELHGPPLRAVVTTTLSALDGGRTRLEQDVEYHLVGGALGKVLGRTLQHLGAGAVLRHGTAAQKRQVEEGG